MVLSLSFSQKYFGVILNRVINYSQTYFYCYTGFKSDHVFSFHPRKNLWKHWNEMIDDMFNRSICDILKEKLVLRSSFDSKLGRGKWERKMKYLYHVKLFSKCRLVICFNRQKLLPSWTYRQHLFWIMLFHDLYNFIYLDTTWGCYS